jgi:hypothetical protein
MKFGGMPEMDPEKLADLSSRVDKRRQDDRFAGPVHEPEEPDDYDSDRAAEAYERQFWGD